jgi:DNA mismatch repair protein MSH5
MDEEMTEEEMADLAEAEAICKRFLEWDLEDRAGLDVKAKLKWVLGVQDGQGSSK